MMVTVATLQAVVCEVIVRIVLLSNVDVSIVSDIINSSSSSVVVIML